MYDAVAEAIPLTVQGQNRKKALLVISDGNDTSSATTVRELKAQIRESEALVYAVGIDGERRSRPTLSRRRRRGCRAADSVPVSRRAAAAGGRVPAVAAAAAVGRRRLGRAASATTASTSSRCAT